MACNATTCKNCKRATKACQIRKAEDGTMCCTQCVEKYNKTTKK